MIRNFRPRKSGKSFPAKARTYLSSFATAGLWRQISTNLPFEAKKARKNYGIVWQAQWLLWKLHLRRRRSGKRNSVIFWTIGSLFPADVLLQERESVMN